MPGYFPPPGGSTPAAIGAPELLYSELVPVGNVGGGIDNLMGFSVPAGTLLTDGDTLEVLGFGGLSGPNNKIVSFLVDGTIVYGLGTTPAEGWEISAVIERVSSTSVRVALLFNSRDFLQSVNVVEPVSDLDSNALTLQFTGQDDGGTTADDNVLQNVMLVKLWRN